MLANNNLKQPLGLWYLSFTEVWERFGFYTIQAILILYMTKALNINDYHANMLYATFGSLVYLSPVLGGYLADRYLGFRQAIMMGGVMFVVGYLVCAYGGDSYFFLGLSIVICANGFFKPNISAILGGLYSENDPRRDGGFTLFYMGINIGALIPPLIAGILIAKFGWHSGFFAAASGMIIGQLVFRRGKKSYGVGDDNNVISSQLARRKFLFYTLFSLGVLAVVSICYFIFQYPFIINKLMGCSAVIITVVVAFFIFKQPLPQRKNMLACIILICISLAFWSLYNQTFTSLTLFAERNMTKHFMGFPFDSEATQFFNPFFMILFAPVLNGLWIYLGKRGLNPSTATKFLLGLVFMMAGFFLLKIGTQCLNINGMVPAWLLCWSYLLQTIGELLISPTGLAMITVLCPKNLNGMMMGVWFFSQAASFAVGGYLANIAVIPEHISAASSLLIYNHAFGAYTFIALGMALVSLTLMPVLNKISS